ncbi:SPARC [Onthophagus taurus]|uniref:SPARC n=1 Tax=Onthophagus taurus TaxID=166361 RepID=UPI000C1FEAF7|nr:SPARC [Onthophagus taurus]XP_022907619.1 SPARC [Onthophagus taurus]XP_022907620.1 SPARC [Onthophagus taurus]
MKYQLLFCIILCVALIGASSTEKPRKHKKVRRIMKPIAIEETKSEPDDIFKIMEEDEKIDEDESKETETIDNRVPHVDPCASVLCSAGRICEINEENEPACVCIVECPEETDPRRKVCSNFNETWPSDCAVYQQRCFCDLGDSRCKGENYKHTHVEYYGSCREMPDCTKEEMIDFPRRMRDWLFNVMRDLADRKELPNHFIKMELEAENNQTRRWTNAAIWKWCDLDGHPADRSVSRHELFPIRAPLMSLEHCIAPFLDSCDVDDDHRIALEEWTKCLGIEEDDFDVKCEELEVRYR